MAPIPRCSLTWNRYIISSNYVQSNQRTICILICREIKKKKKRRKTFETPKNHKETKQQKYNNNE